MPFVLVFLTITVVTVWDVHSFLTQWYNDVDWT